MQAHISGHLNVRPVRLGLAVRPRSPKDLLRAVERATRVWGGVADPLVPVKDADSAVNLAERLDVDVAAPVGSSDAIEEFTQATGFSWRSIEGTPFRNERRDPFVLETELVLESLTSTRSAEDLRFAHVTWDDEHPLANLFALHYGVLGDEDDAFGHRYRAIAEPVTISRTDPMPVADGRHSQLGVSAHELVRYGRFLRAGFVVVDVNRLSHLHWYWNQRAMANRVFPWPRDHPDLVVDAARHWLARVVSDGLPAWGDEAHLTLWTGGDDIPRELSDLVDEELPPDAMRVLDRLDDIDGVGEDGSPFTTDFGRSFSADVSDETWSVELPMPPIDFLPRRPWFSEYGAVAVDIRPSTEWNLPPGRRPLAPRVRMMTPALSDLPSPLLPFARATLGGLAIGTDLRRDTVTLPLVSSHRLIETVFRASGARTETSDAGRRMARIVDLFAGAYPDSYVNEPGVRHVMTKAANSTYGVLPAKLLEVARNNAGSWPQHMYYRGGQEDYGAEVLQHLTALKVLLPRLKMRCLSCSTVDSYSADELASEVACQLCNEHSNLGLALALKPAPQWVLASSPALRAEFLAETFPVLATVSLFSALEDRGRQLPHYALGVEVSQGDWRCEVDALIVMDTYEQPLMVACEAKSHRDELDDQDVQNLVRVQALARDAGIDCYLAFSTLRETLTDSEQTLLRGLAEDAPEPLRSRRGMGSTPTLPLAFVAADLSAHTWEEDHLLRTSQRRGSVAALAVETCKRNLGFAHFAWDDPEFAEPPRVVWDDRKD